MREYTPYLISALALLFSAYQFVKASQKEDTSQITTVLIKLENIAELVAEIKTDVKDERVERQELRERLVKAESSIKSAHKRIDGIEQKLSFPIDNEKEG